MIEHNNSMLSKYRREMQNKFSLLCIPRKPIDGLQNFVGYSDPIALNNKLNSEGFKQNFLGERERTNECPHVSRNDSEKNFDEQCYRNQKPVVIQTLKIFEKLEYFQQKRIKVVTKNFLSAYPYILFSLSILQKENYPHLFTLIKQHFYRPGMFQDFEPFQSTLFESKDIHQNSQKTKYLKQKKILQLCQNFFKCISELTEEEEKPITTILQKQFEQSPLFLEVCLHILTKILKGQSKSEQEFKSQTWIQEIKLLCKKFNVDSSQIDFNQQYQLIPREQDTKNSCVEILAIGLNRIFFMVCEHSSVFYILETDSVKKYKKQKTNKKQYKHFQHLENPHMHEISERDTPNLIQVSEESTPKFKQNQESIRYRKKSHKNSFGGDMDIFNYNDLSRLQKGKQKIFGNFKNQNQDQKIRQKKVFSERFQAFQMSPLTVDDQNQKAFDINEPNQAQNFKTAMRESHIDGRGFKKDAKIRQQKMWKESKLSSSEILQINTKFKQSVESKQSNKYINNSSGEASDEKQAIQINPHYNEIEFKMSFSPKDAEKYQMTSNQYEYQQLVAIYETQKREMHKSVKYQKYEIQPIAEQAQSSQQQDKKEEDPNIRYTQFQVEQRIDSPGFQIEQFADGFTNKMKNRKFSYLTQPITPSKKESQIIMQDQQESKQKKHIQKVFKIQKLHKNSQAITQGSPKVRFEENPISFSQIMADQQHNFLRQQTKCNENTNKKRQFFSSNGQKFRFKLNHERNVVNFASGSYQISKQNQQANFIYKQPKNWVKRETIYYFADKPPEKFTIQKYQYLQNPSSRDERECFKKNKRLKHFKTIDALRWESSENEDRKSKEDEYSASLQQKLNIQNSKSNFKNNITELSITSLKRSPKKMKSQHNNIRSTIDTQILSTSPITVDEGQNKSSKSSTIKGYTQNINKKAFYPRDSKSNKKPCPSIYQENQQTLYSDSPASKLKFIPKRELNLVPNGYHKQSNISANGENPQEMLHQKQKALLVHNNQNMFINESRQIQRSNNPQKQINFARDVSHPHFYSYHPKNMGLPPMANNHHNYLLQRNHEKNLQPISSHVPFHQQSSKIISPSHQYNVYNPTLYGSHPSPQQFADYPRKSTSQPKVNPQKFQNVSKQAYISPCSFTSISSGSPKYDPRKYEGPTNYKASFQSQNLIRHIPMSPTMTENKFFHNQRVQSNSFNSLMYQH